MSDVEKRLVLRIDPEPAKKDANDIKKSVRELTIEASKLKSSFRNLSKNTNFNKLKEQVTGVGTGFKGLSTKANNTATAFEKLKKSSNFSSSLLSSTEKTNTALDGMKRSVVGANDSLNKIKKTKDDATKSTKKLTSSQEAMNQGFQNSAKAVQLALGPLSGIAARITATATLFRNNTAAIAGFVGAVTGIAVATTTAVRAGMEFERQMLSISSAIQVTGRESVTTTEELNSLAESIAEATLSGTTETRKAISILLTYNNIAVSAFEEITIAAQGIASTLGMGLTSATRMVARAIEEPIRSMESLRRVGITFSDQQRVTIRAMEDMGMTAAAQAVIMGELAVFQKTAVDEAGGLAGALDTYRERVQKVFESISEGANTNDKLKDSLNIVNSVINDFLNDSSKLDPLIKSVEITVNTLAKTFAFLADNIQTVSVIFSGVLASTLTASLIKLTSFGLAVTGLGSSFLFASAGAKALGAAIATFAPVLAGVAAAAGMLYLAFVDTSDVVEGLKSSVEETGKKFESFDEVINRSTNSLGFMNEQGVKALELSFANLSKEYEEFTNKVSSSRFGDEIKNELLKGLQSSEVENAIDVVYKTIDSISEDMNQGTFNVQLDNSIEEMLQGVINGSEEAIEQYSQFKAVYEDLGVDNKALLRIDDWLLFNKRVEEAESQLKYFQDTVKGTKVSLEDMDVSKIMERVMSDTDRGLTSVSDLQDKFAAKFADEVLLGDPDQVTKRVNEYYASYKEAMVKNIDSIEDLSDETKTILKGFIDDEIAENVNRILNPSMDEEKLSKILKNASDATSEFNREMKALVMTTEEYEAFQQQESIDKLVESFGLAETASAKTSDGLIATLEQMKNIEGIASAINPLIEGLSSGFLDQASAAEVAEEVLRQHATSLGLYGETARDSAEAAKELAEREAEATKKRESLIASYDDVFSIQLDYRNQVEQINELIEDSSLKEDMLAKAQRNRDESLNNLSKSQDDYWKSLDDTAEKLEFEISLIGKSEEKVSELNAARAIELFTEKKRAEAIAAGIILEGEKLDLLDAEIAKVVTLMELRDEQLKTQAARAKAEEEMLKLSEAITDGIMDGFEAAMDGMESFRDFFNDMLKKLALDAIRNRIVIPIVTGEKGEASGSIGGSLSGLMGGNEKLAGMSNTQMLVSGGIGYGAASMMGGTGEYSGIGSSAGTILGGAVGGPVGAAVGSFLGSVVGGLFSQSKTVERSVEVSMEGLVAKAFDITTTTRSRLFRSDKVTKFREAITDGTTDIIERGFGESVNNINRAAENLGVMTSDSLNTFKFTLEEESISIAGVIDKASDEYTRHVFAAVQKYSKAGESMNDAIVRIGESISNIDTGLFLSTGGGIDSSYGDVIKESSEQIKNEYEKARELITAEIEQHQQNIVAIEMDLTKVGGDFWKRAFIDDFKNQIKEGLEEYNKIGDMIDGSTAEALTQFSEGVQKALSSLTDVDMDGAAALFNKINAEWTKAVDGDEVLAKRRLELAKKEVERISSSAGIVVTTSMTMDQADRAMNQYLDSVKESAMGTEDYAATVGVAEGSVAALKGALLDADNAMQTLSDSLRGLVDSAMRGVEDAVSREKQALTDAYNARVEVVNNRLSNLREELSIIQEQERALGDLQRIAKALTDTANRLLMDDPVSRITRREQSQAFLSSTLSSVRSGGSFPDIDTLQQHLSAISEPSEDMFGSFTDYARDFLKTKRDIEDLADLANDQLTSEEQLLNVQKSYVMNQISHNERLLVTMRDEHRDEMAALDEQLNEAQQLYNAAMGINTSVLTVAEAIAGLRQAILQLNSANPVIERDRPILDTRTRPIDQIGNLYQDLLGRDIGEEGLNYWRSALESGQTIDDVRRNIMASEEYSSIPGFANGGDHTGGLRVVGEAGPELEWTPPSKIYSNSQSKEIFDTSEMVSELMKLREEVGMLRHETRAVVGNTKKTAKLMDDVTQGGTTIRTQEVVE